MNKLTTALSLLSFIFVFVYGPIVTIWSLNTLFALNIKYTLYTWLAVTWLVLLGKLVLSATMHISSNVVPKKD